MAVGGVGLLLLLVTLFSGAVFMVHRKRKLVKKLTELQEPNESSSLLNSTSTSNHTGYTSTQGISKSELLPLHNKFWLYIILIVCQVAILFHTIMCIIQCRSLLQAV